MSLPADIVAIFSRGQIKPTWQFWLILFGVVLIGPVLLLLSFLPVNFYQVAPETARIFGAVVTATLAGGVLEYRSRMGKVEPITKALADDIDSVAEIYHIQSTTDLIASHLLKVTLKNDLSHIFEMSEAEAEAVMLYLDEHHPTLVKGKRPRSYITEPETLEEMMVRGFLLKEDIPEEEIYGPAVPEHFQPLAAPESPAEDDKWQFEDAADAPGEVYHENTLIKGQEDDRLPEQ